jgi:hypothetical protein
LVSRRKSLSAGSEGTEDRLRVRRADAEAGRDYAFRSPLIGDIGAEGGVEGTFEDFFRRADEVDRRRNARREEAGADEAVLLIEVGGGAVDRRAEERPAGRPYSSTAMPSGTRMADAETSANFSAPSPSSNPKVLA